MEALDQSNGVINPATRELVEKLPPEFGLLVSRALVEAFLNGIELGRQKGRVEGRREQTFFETPWSRD